MARNLYDLIEAALALPRAERTALMERLRDSLREPDVPGGIIVQPQDLLEFGARYVFPDNGHYVRETVTLTAMPGPTLSTTWGAIAIADPWFPEAAPTTAATLLGAGEHPTVVAAIPRTRVDTGVSELWPVAAAVGRVEEVATWHPLPDDGQFQLDSDSSLGAFYEITDAALLQPLFEDGHHMQDVFNRALEGLIVPMEAQGRVVAAVSRCRKDLHPAWVGYDAAGVGVAALVDFGVLASAAGRVAQ